MADKVLSRVLSGEIDVNLFVKWLSGEDVTNGDENIENQLSLNIGRIDFVTYFLNFIHEEVLCSSTDTVCDASQSIHAPKRVEHKVSRFSNKEDAKKRVSLFTATSSEKKNNNTLNDDSITTYSTPKAVKKALEISYYSPVSPIYSNKPSFNSNSQNTTKTPVSLGDFMGNTKSSTKKKRNGQSTEAKKRINPTNVHYKRSSDIFQATENSFDFQNYSDKEIVMGNVETQRNALVEEKVKLLSRKSTTVVPKLPNKKMYKIETEPNVKEVTHKSSINCIVDIYSTLLNCNMVLNINSEIYFLVSLLLCKKAPNGNNFSKMNDSDELNLGVKLLNDTEELPFNLANRDTNLVFQSVHNIVYFACKSLQQQISILKYYDRTTLKLLSNNERLRNMCPNFAAELQIILENKHDNMLDVTSTDDVKNVHYNMDTDNKDNFPDQGNFHAFRKQRDMFYEILRIWETHHVTPDWIFALGLSGKIKTLLSLSNEPSNYTHLSRLFKNHLLATCSKNSNRERGLSEAQLNFLPSLAIDADKLNRLTSRLTTKQSCNGINSVPVFTGYQEFYKDFIVVGSNYSFNRHLCDCLITDIVNLNETKFAPTDLEDQDTGIDPNTRKLYTDCIKNLRILAKFLGFIESLPYKSNCLELSRDLLEANIKIRKNSFPQLNIKPLLSDSITNGTVVLLVPWVIEYLAMLDYVTLRLPYYQSVLFLLFDLYYKYNKSRLISCNGALVRYCLGWLFELPHFPDNEFFNYCSKTSENFIEIKSNCDLSLDQMNLVDQNVLNLCCPYLGEIKNLLSCSTSTDRLSVKHITPVSAIESNLEVAKKKMEHQLEEAFFNSQPSSLRKTVEFVSERVASSIVKHICHNLVPEFKETALNEFREVIQKVGNSIDENEAKALLKRQATLLSEQLLGKLLEPCDEHIAKISKEKIPPSIENLLPLDALHQTKLVCTTIATKMCVQRVKQWSNNHVTVGVFRKDFDVEIQKAMHKKNDKDRLPFALPPAGSDCKHDETCLSGFHMLNKIRDICCVVADSKEVTVDIILEVLMQCQKTLTERNDVNDVISSSICITLFDLCLLLAANEPSILVDSVLQEFVKVWLAFPKVDNVFRNLFSPRNVQIFLQSKDIANAWDLYAKILLYFVDKEVLALNELESQCTGFYKRNWNDDVLKWFSYFLKRISNNKSSDMKFDMLIDFLSDFCSDL